MSAPRIIHGDCLAILPTLADASVDAVITDPPYGLEFMGREWDGADGFRRSLNPNDADRDNAFGRTSRTSPEYRTASKAQAEMRPSGMADHGPGEIPSFLGGLNPKCLTCDKWQRGRNPCQCDAPQFTQERLVRLHTFQEWCEAWSRECLRVLRPGGHLLAFGGTRTFHRLACAVEDAGFEVRDSIAWLYGSGFPKSLDVSKAIDKAAGAERAIVGPGQYANRGRRTDNAVYAEATPSAAEVVTLPATPDAERWQGWGTALKPAFEPIVVARKPLTGTVAANVLTHGTGALNVDGCRIEGARPDTTRGTSVNASSMAGSLGGQGRILDDGRGRWPANVVLDGYREPVLRLRYNLPTEVERTIRESFGARTDHLSAVSDASDGPAKQGAATEVLFTPVQGSMDVREPDGRTSAAIRQAALSGVPREDEPQRPRAQGSGEPAVEGWDVPHEGLRNGPTGGADARGVDPVRPDAYHDIAGRLPAGAQAGGGAQAGEAACADRACASHERGQRRQPTGEPRGSFGGGTQADSREGRGRAAEAATGERHAIGAPLEVLRSECPPGWWHYFEVVAHRQSQAEALDEQSGVLTSGLMRAGTKPRGERETYGQDAAGGYETAQDTPGDSGGASRFFYVAKADASERVRVNGTAHPTVKPLALMRWLVRLVTPPGGTVLEPFAGSGTTVEACLLEGFDCIAIEREADYLPLIQQRIDRRRDPVAAVKAASDDGGLFDLLDGGAA